MRANLFTVATAGRHRTRFLQEDGTRRPRIYDTVNGRIGRDRARGGGVETERGGVRRSFSGGGASPARARVSRAAPRELEAEASFQIWLEVFL